MRVLRRPFSTNVERVALAAGFKGIAVEWVDVDPLDRTLVREVSEQELVPVLVEDDGRVTADSPLILRRLEELHPDPPLWPHGVRARAEADVFVDWFNLVWKVAPNALEAAELETASRSDAPDGARMRELGAQITAHLDVFEGLLDGRDFLLGDEVTVADFTAFPFLRYAVDRNRADTERFHEILRERMPLDAHPRVAAWIARVDALPRA